MVWRLQADHGRKHETGGEMIIRGLDTKRPITEALVMAMALGFTAPAMAQTHPAPDTETSSVPINANMVGASVVALATTSGLRGRPKKD